MRSEGFGFGRFQGNSLCRVRLSLGVIELNINVLDNVKMPSSLSSDEPSKKVVLRCIDYLRQCSTNWSLSTRYSFLIYFCFLFIYLFLVTNMTCHCLHHMCWHVCLHVWRLAAGGSTTVLAGFESPRAFACILFCSV